MKKTIYFLIVLIISIGCKDYNSDKKLYSENGYLYSDDDTELVQNFSVQDNEEQKASSDSKLIKESHLRFETTSIDKSFV